MIFSRSVHVVANASISSFHMTESYPIACMYHVFFIQSSIEGHFICFRVLATVNSAAINIRIHILFSNKCFQKFGVDAQKRDWWGLLCFKGDTQVKEGARHLSLLCLTKKMAFHWPSQYRCQCHTWCLTLVPWKLIFWGTAFFTPLHCFASCAYEEWAVLSSESASGPCLMCLWSWGSFSQQPLPGYFPWSPQAPLPLAARCVSPSWGSLSFQFCEHYLSDFANQNQGTNSVTCCRAPDALEDVTWSGLWCIVYYNS